LTNDTLAGLGWSDHFERQLRDEDRALTPARIAEVHRARLNVLAADGPHQLVPTEASGAYAVGDWVLSDGEKAQRRLTPTSDIARRAAGHTAEAQRIAANIDTLAIVTSCNADFNVARLERYLAMAHSAGCLPLIVLTKSDRAEGTAAADYLRRAGRLSPLVQAIALDATEPEEAERLMAWCRDGQTLALVGSSGVGKTTLRNALTGEFAETQGIREDDARGRHTTTTRSLVATRSGGWLVDTPGMRELQLIGAEEGINAVFEDIETLAQTCHYRDCAHMSEPGCAVQAAVREGKLDPDRLARWDKLIREDRHNNESVAETRARGKSFGRIIKTAQAKGRRKRDPESRH
jgi:ribosome biogenesis GTPase